MCFQQIFLFFLMLRALTALVLPSCDTLLVLPHRKPQVLFQALPSPAAPRPPAPVSSCFQLPQFGEKFKVGWVSVSGKLGFVSFVWLKVPLQKRAGVWRGSELLAWRDQLY